MKKLSALLLATALALPSTSFAATNGTLGATSTGSVEVSLTATSVSSAGNAKITGLQDFAFATVTTNNAPTPITVNNICVFLSTASTYAIDIASSQSSTAGQGNLRAFGTDEFGAATAFVLGYTWLYTAGGVSVTSANGTGLTGSSTAGCASGTTASLTLTPATPSNDGDYTDTLTLTVSPE